MTVRQFYTMANRALSVSVLSIVFIVSVSAYTVVMKNGRRIEVPEPFIVTPSTLTYEVQPGIQITLQMPTIDIASTEKANNEAPGSLLRRGLATNRADGDFLEARGSARKTITNRDLEANARRRVASEQAYGKRIKELGLPSLEESRKQAETESAIAQSELHERLGLEKQTENYWRARADAMRTEMLALDAQINYVRTKLEETPVWNWGWPYALGQSAVPFVSFGGVGGRGPFPGSLPPRARVYSARDAGGPQMAGRVGFGGGTTRGRAFINPGQPGRGQFGHGLAGRGVAGNVAFGSSVGIWPSTPLFGSFGAYDNSWERSELITRFNDLATARAALNARWRELEDEARRAGVPPGWLRK